jgi:hypothetical protein
MTETISLIILAKPRSDSDIFKEGRKVIVVMDAGDTWNVHEGVSLAETLKVLSKEPLVEYLQERINSLLQYDWKLEIVYVAYNFLSTAKRLKVKRE